MRPRLPEGPLPEGSLGLSALFSSWQTDAARRTIVTLDGEPFYMPDPSLFGQSDAYRLYTRFAAALWKARLSDRFPNDPDLRKLSIELLAERENIEDVERDPGLIDEAIAEAHVILSNRTS